MINRRELLAFGLGLLLSPNKVQAEEFRYAGLHVVSGQAAARHQARLLWMLDSGASFSMLPPKIAEEIELPIEGEINVQGIIRGASARVPYATIPRVYVDTWTMRENIQVALIDTEHFGWGDRLGILGMNYLPRLDCLRR